MELEVQLGADRLGVFSHDPSTDRYAFAYAPAWLARADRFALSAALPLVPDKTLSADEHSRRVRQFFENLLPEGEALDNAAAIVKVSKSSIAGLLAALGRETAGALRIGQANVPESVPASQRRLVTDEELSERIRGRPFQPFSIWDGRVRLSIAGYQDKVAVYRDAGCWYLVDGPVLASTHILKPEPTREVVAGLTSNEFFCLRLASAAGVDAAHVELVFVPEPVLQIARFDRRVTSSGIERVHTIDGCQALGLPVSAKYERPYGSGRDVAHIRDGASFPRLFALAQDTARPLQEKRALLRWAIFQILVGNADAHAKNLAFYSNVSGLSLAPAYDITSLYALASEQLDRTYAMAIGDAFEALELSAYEWSSFAADCGLPPAFVRRELIAMANTVNDAAPRVAAITIAAGADPNVVRLIAGGVQAECIRQIGMAAGIRKARAG